MSELTQRLKERLEIWHEERKGGSSGAPSEPPEPCSRRNPLVWGIFVAIGALLPPWHFRDASDLLLPACGILFLVLYFVSSRFAWHVLAAHLLVVVPLYVFLSPSWRLQRLLDPRIIWFPAVCTIAALAFLIWSRRRYFEYLRQQKQPREV